MLTVNGERWLIIGPAASKGSWFMQNKLVDGSASIEVSRGTLSQTFQRRFHVRGTHSLKQPQHKNIRLFSHVLKMGFKAKLEI